MLQTGTSISEHKPRASEIQCYETKQFHTSICSAMSRNATQIFKSETVMKGKSASLNARPRAIFCHFSFFFQCVLKYFLQGVVDYWSIFRIKINLSESFNGTGKNSFLHICRNRLQAHYAMQHAKNSLLLALFCRNQNQTSCLENASRNKLKTTAEPRTGLQSSIYYLKY